MTNTGLKPKGWKLKKRKDHSTVNIDGRNYVWASFKSQFAEDLETRMAEGQQVPTTAEFVLNKGQTNEKILTWSERGWLSEDSEN